MSVRRTRLVAWLAGLAGWCAVAAAAPNDAPALRVAVATNFKPTVENLCAAFHRARPGRCVVSSGASGLLYAKIMQGAPFDVFLSADVGRAARLEAESRAAPGSRFTYAIGQLALWRPGTAARGDPRAALEDPAVRTLAIANPDTAPYGVAALETLRAIGIPPGERFEIVRGESVGQAFQFVASGAVSAGFVALSQVLEYRVVTGRDIRGEVLVVDDRLHQPIEQQAVLLSGAQDGEHAQAFLDFLRAPEARRVIVAAGYSVPPQ
jgi:molybdate transport system substrate-binding protein